MVTMVKNAGTAISNLSHSINLKEEAIMTPTIISAGAVTAEVTTDKIGKKNNAKMKHAAVTNEAKPVFAPAATPALDSTKEVVVEVPNTAPTIVAMESETNALPAFGSLPSFTNPAWFATATSVPALSKKSTNKNVRIIPTIVVDQNELSPNEEKTAPNVGAMLGTVSTTLWGTSIKPKIMPTTAVMIIPKNTAAFTPLVIKMTVTIRPKIVSNVGPFEKSPKPTSVESFFTMRPEVCMPIKVINKPIPAPIAYFNCVGIKWINFSRSPVSVNRKKKIPEINTAPRACCHGILLPNTTV